MYALLRPSYACVFSDAIHQLGPLEPVGLAPAHRSSPAAPRGRSGPLTGFMYRRIGGDRRSAKPITSRTNVTTPVNLNTSKINAMLNKTTSTRHAHRRRRTSAASNIARMAARITKPATIPTTVTCLCGESKTFNSPTTRGCAASNMKATSTRRVLPSTETFQLNHRRLSVVMRGRSPTSQPCQAAPRPKEAYP